MDNKLKEKIIESMVKKNYKIFNEEDIADFLQFEPRIKTYNYDKHRWYTSYTTIVQIEDYFVKFDSYDNKGDEPAFEPEEEVEMIMRNAEEVFPKQVLKTIYVTKKQL